MATKRKVKRYAGEDESYVDPMEAANASEDAQAIMEQAKGEEILKRMRDTEAAQQEMPKRRMENASPDMDVKPIGRSKPMPGADVKPLLPAKVPPGTKVSDFVNPNAKTNVVPAAKNENYSNEGRSRPAPMPSAKKETYRDISGKTREKSESKRPDFGGAIGRGISDFFGSIRERGRRSNPEAYAKGGSVGSASKRADGIAQRGKTKGKIC
jgi:hypothetical protein